VSRSEDFHEKGREIILVGKADDAGIRGLSLLKAGTAALAGQRWTSPEGVKYEESKLLPLWTLCGQND
jgi:hypothetical protein